MSVTSVLYIVKLKPKDYNLWKCFQRLLFLSWVRNDQWWWFLQWYVGGPWHLGASQGRGLSDVANGVDEGGGENRFPGGGSSGVWGWRPQHLGLPHRNRRFCCRQGACGQPPTLTDVDGAIVVQSRRQQRQLHGDQSVQEAQAEAKAEEEEWGWWEFCPGDLFPSSIINVLQCTVLYTSLHVDIHTSVHPLIAPRCYICLWWVLAPYVPVNLTPCRDPFHPIDLHHVSATSIRTWFISLSQKMHFQKKINLSPQIHNIVVKSEKAGGHQQPFLVTEQIHLFWGKEAFPRISWWWGCVLPWFWSAALDPTRFHEYDPHSHLDLSQGFSFQHFCKILSWNLFNICYS